MARAKVSNYSVQRGMNYVVRKKWKFKPAPTAESMPVVAGPAPRPLAPPLGELVVFSSPQTQCGIAEYSRDLDVQLRAVGVNVRQHTLAELDVLRNVQPGTVLLLHVEPSLLPTDFDNALATAISRGAYVGVCFHYLDEVLYRRFANRSHAMIAHRNYGISDPLLHEVPLGCPVYDAPSDSRRRQLREQLGLPVDATIVTTVGFLSPWKKIPEVSLQLLAQMPDQSRMFLQLVCPAHFSGESRGEVEKLQQVHSLHAHRSYWASSFVPVSELLDRVAASDLGFVYHQVNTGSCSAATKPFVSARCPVVVTSSNHASDVAGAYRVPNFDVGSFAQTVLDVARDPRMLQDLRSRMQADYERLNMNRVAQMYVDVYRKIGVNLA